MGGTEKQIAWEDEIQRDVIDPFARSWSGWAAAKAEVALLLLEICMESAAKWGANGGSWTTQNVSRLLHDMEIMIQDTDLRLQLVERVVQASRIKRKHGADAVMSYHRRCFQREER